MHRLLTGIFALVLSFCTTAESSRNAVHAPDISDNWVSFVYDENIWLVSRDGGMARQLTNEDGPVKNGSFSPDGSFVAYTKVVEGNSDVYLLPTEGGISKRLTYHPEEDSVVGWHPSQNQLLFKSIRESYRPSFNQFYHLSPEGGYIEKLPLTYAETGSYCQDGQHLVYTYTNDFQDSNETWKRYKGGRAPDVWLYDAEQQSIDTVTDYQGIDTMPMCIGNDIYFLSDRGAENRSNIWVRRGQRSVADGAQFEQITFFEDHDIRHPSSSEDAIVFENGGYLYVYEVTSNELNKLDIQLASQQRNMDSVAVPLQDNLASIALSSDGRMAYISARGEVLSYQIDTGILKNLTQSSDVAERFPSVSEQGVLAYMADQGNEYQLFTQAVDGQAEQLTDFPGDFRFKPFWSPNGRYMAYVDNIQNIHVLNVASGKDSLIGQSQWKIYSALRAMNFNWSPDSNWLLFTMADQARNQSVFLYDIKSRRLEKITAGFYNDLEAVFCGEGAFICLLSQREFNPTHGDIDSTWTYSGSTGLYLMPLQAGTRSPFSGLPAAELPEYQWQGIDSLDLEPRLVKAPIKSGLIRSLHAAGMNLIYQRQNTEGEQQIYTFDLRSGKETLLLSKAYLVDVSANSQVLAFNAKDKTYQYLSIQTKQFKQIDFSGYSIQVNPDQEKYQIVRDAWRFYRDFYYDPELHGRDWQQEWQRYEALIESAHTAEDINRIVRELGGELEGGHVWATSTPARVRWKNTTVGLLGVDLRLVGDYYRIEKIYAPAPWWHEDRSPLAEPGLPELEGKYLLAIDNVELKPNQSPWYALEGHLEQWVELEVADTPEGRNTQTVQVKTIGSERRMRELDWVESNRRYVNEKTQGRVGYLYVPDTSRTGQDDLMKQYQAQYHKDALIIDARFNSGGALGDRLVELLNRPVLNYFSTRNAEDSRLPELANSGPKVLITNGWSYSGGDGFPFLFQEAGVGPVLGEHTWGGLIGPSQPIPLINGSAVSPAPQRVYDAEGHWGTGGDIGVTPDIPVKNLPGDLIKGVDAQLDRAIEWSLQQLNEAGPKTVPPIARGD